MSVFSAIKTAFTKSADRISKSVGGFMMQSMQDQSEIDKERAYTRLLNGMEPAQRAQLICQIDREDKVLGIQPGTFSFLDRDHS